ncbi:3-oxoacyl-ACP reductase [Streptomyces armeniacus]|uniref:3-oxoacyl-ACP reductase n=1 Tax=Streptomyces armeniacus TaxID=83291 RepID=A0A345XN47_9ACTN|nr:3-oxoacyl-ACP reductase [Streptomyces armeniacus]AXK33063.1 3-oxoacyl-ACP reductase [Streptomyces armeniacus]
MADRYLHWTRTGPGRFLSRRLGLPQPARLHRWSAERPVLEGGPLLHLTAGRTACDGAALAAALGGCGLPVRTKTADTSRPETHFSAVVLDATGIRSAAELGEVHSALHPVVRSLAANGRVVLLGSVPAPDDHHQAAAQQALEGFVRSLGKELTKGCTAQLVRVRVAPGAHGEAHAGTVRTGALESTLHFLLSPKSAYVSGQSITVDPSLPTAAAVPEAGDGHSGGRTSGDRRAAGPARPLAGRTALVTGAARGIGAAVAETLARDGAHVVCLDVPQSEPELSALAERLGGSALPMDIGTPFAGADIAAALPSGGLDVLVQNAGITRDRRLANMSAERWRSVLDINLAAVLRTTDHLLGSGAVRAGGRIVATASIAGIAGNTGQTNYAASKAGVAGMVRSLAPRAAAEHGVTVNAVAPGFIETRMTAAVPFFVREAGRRMNSLSQGGLPADVAETVAWFAHPGSGGVNGQVVRVCGQSLLGA